MYKKILLPVDGSTLSNATALAGIRFAEGLSAEIVGLYVATTYQYPGVMMMPPTYQTQDDYERSLREVGESFFTAATKEAEKRRVTFSWTIKFGDKVAHEIAKMAREDNYDLIFIGSHGRNGWGQLILGSVTNKLMSLSEIPVLVHRFKNEEDVLAGKVG